MRLTSREKEILEVLRKEPLISQDELAQRLGITRSSVAVHISNLMKKGVILGKGYVFNEQASIVVIGESCMSINIKKQREKDIIDAEYGGFAMGISGVFANMGAGVKLITVIGNDELGTALLDKLQEKEIDINYIYRHPGKRSCRKVLVNGEMAFEEGFTLEDYQKAIDAKEWVALNCEWLVIEPQFQELVYKKVLSRDEDKLPYFCTCRYMTVPEEIPDFLHRYYALVLGVADSRGLDFYLDKASKLVNKGMQKCILTDGNSRLSYISNQGVADFPLLPNQCFDSCESLPVLLAGLIYGLSCGYPLRQAVRIGIGIVSGNESKKH